MWRGFNVDMGGAFFKNTVVGVKSSLWDELIAEAKNSRLIWQRNIREKIVSDKWVVDGNGIESNWFPKVSNHVFISHSHADEQLALALAGALKKWLNIDSFVDSAIWGHFEELQKLLFNKVVKYGKPKVAEEKFNLWNTVSTHVHCMLFKSLIQMIDQCECLIFLNTPSSIPISDIAGKPSTYSPWIYTEIEVSKFLRRRPDPRRPQTPLLKEAFAKDASLEFLVEYPLSINHLTRKTGSEIWNWICAGSKVLNNGSGVGKEYAAFRALDLLYDNEKRKL